MILLHKLKLQSSFACYPLCVILFIVSAALTNPQNNTNKQVKSDYYRDKSSKNLSDSLEVLLSQIRSSFGGKELNLTLGVVKDGHVFLKKNYGYANPETKTRFSDRTQIYIASTSKSLTGTLAAILDRKGIIRLDGTIADYLPGFTFDDQKIHPDKITIRSLITHTHGIKNNDAVVWTAFIGIKSTEQLMAMLKTRSTALPDDRFNYSNLGPVIYSMIVEKQLGKPWQEVMDDYLFQPLGMKKTTAYVSKAAPKYISYVIDESEGKLSTVFDKADNSMSAAGGHLTTVADLLKYLQFFISEGNSVPGVLSKEEIAMATSAIVPQKNRYQSYERFGYGLGWEQSVFNGEQLVSRLGGYSGISSHLSFMKDQKIGVVVLSNKKGMEALAHLVANYIYNSILNKDNKRSIAKENLLSLQKNFESDTLETKEITEAINKKIPMDKKLSGRYDGAEKSGTMEINNAGKVSWGNLKGQLHLLTDSTGLINFRTMLRSFSVKKENNVIVGVYSNDRYFKLLR
ncbi:CubicO group peptidase, beta-lactamase class C family [Pedobacter steynii]|uniref:CubicO group peptidase, beta-lactamase class C family n=1 Tax=Pedobacter steynii TaxID=430522 RepID=A0A1H0C951_9SPHI|nr:serine hydrolase [Pedobacter steynii]NQX41501.1 serine hydrolase [Pedobacter steynii]SDN54361.1 CubicO group peptidase, beta-lactamase class C family [Pedobacter steynii]